MRYYLGYRFIYSAGRNFKMTILLRDGMGRCWYGQVIWEIRILLGVVLVSILTIRVLLELMTVEREHGSLHHFEQNHGVTTISNWVNC